MAAAGCEESIPDTMKQAVKRDIAVISELAKISPEFILEQCGMRDCGLALPFWKIGEPVELFQGEEDDCLHNLWEYYRCNGCGMYARYRAFIWRDKKILPVAHPDSQRLCELKGYDVPRNMAIENTVAFLRGLPANNCLLYGDRGTGKSSTVKALLNEYYTQGLRVIEMPKEYLMDFPYLVDQIAGIPMNSLFSLMTSPSLSRMAPMQRLNRFYRGDWQQNRPMLSFMPPLTAVTCCGRISPTAMGMTFIEMIRFRNAFLWQTVLGWPLTLRCLIKRNFWKLCSNWHFKRELKAICPSWKKVRSSGLWYMVAVLLVLHSNILPLQSRHCVRESR